MKYYCDSCLAKAVLSGRVRPLVEVWGANETPFKLNVICAECGKQGGKHDGFSAHPYMQELT